MAEHTLRRLLTINRDRESVFDFFSDAENLQVICPPELDFTILTPRPIEIQKGTLIDYKLKLRGFPIKWRTLISEWDPPNSFVDESLRGPYKQWIHTHTFTDNPDGGTDIEDVVRYRLPLEPLGDLGHWIVKRELKYIFDYRQEMVAKMLDPESD